MMNNKRGPSQRKSKAGLTVKPGKKNVTDASLSTTQSLPNLDNSKVHVLKSDLLPDHMGMKSLCDTGAFQFMDDMRPKKG